MSMETYLVPRLDVVHSILDKALAELSPVLPYALAAYAALKWLSTDEQRKTWFNVKANQACLLVIIILGLSVTGKVFVPTTAEYLDNARKIRLAEKQLAELNKEQQAPAPAQEPAQ